MSTFYSQGNGSWSTTTNWDTNTGGGGTDPTAATEAGMDDHTYVIQANHAIELDVNMTAWANGIQGLTITSHATTPGMLYSKTSAGTWCLSLKSGATLVGTNAATKGRLLANSNGTWGGTGALGATSLFCINLKGTAYIDATYLDVNLLDTEPTYTSVSTYGQVFHECAVAAAGNTLTYTGLAAATPNGTLVRVSAGSGALPAELTAATDYWVVGASGNTVQLATSSGGSAIDLSAGGPIHLHTGWYANWGVSGNTLTKTTHGIANNVAVMVQSSGTLPTPLVADTIYYVVSTAAGAISLALTSGGTALTLGGSPSGTLDVYAGSTGAAPGLGGTNPYTSTMVNTLTNISADTQWASGAAVVLADAGPVTYDQQRTTLGANAAADTLTLGAAVDSVQCPGARVFLMTRNVAIRSNTTGSGNLITDGSTTQGRVFRCEIRSTAGTGTTFYGTGLNGGAGHTVSGTVSGCGYGLNGGTGYTVSGTVSGCNYALNGGAGHTVSGTVSGCSYGLNGGTGYTVSGTVSGCNYALNGGTGYTVSGTVSGCSTGVNGGAGHTVSGTVSGCGYGLNGAGHTVSGTVSGCGYGLNGGTGYTVSGTVSGCGAVCRINPDLAGPLDIIVRGSATIPIPPTFSGRNVAGDGRRGLVCEDYNGVLGASYGFYCTGDVIRNNTEVRSGGASSSLEVVPLSECATGSEVPIFSWTEMDVPASEHTKTVYIEGTGWSTFPAAATLWIEAEWYNSASASVFTKTITRSTTVLTENSVWTAFTVTFTPAKVSPVRYRAYLGRYEAGAKVYVDAQLS